MKNTAFAFFHLNLAFSAISKEERPSIIENCYWPLLDIIESTGIPIGIEVSGWTLAEIMKLDQSWTAKFKKLIRQKKSELIGSGYIQLIGPLVPHSVNIWNQKIGIDIYKDILDCTPTLALVSEMAFSSSLIDLYYDVGYSGVIMDRNNISYALNIDEGINTGVPSHGIGPQGGRLPVLWSDSLLFQKLQHYLHGNITRSEYFDYVRKCKTRSKVALSIYANDAEVLDYRPGRFGTEGKPHPEGEWRRFRSIIVELDESNEVDWCSPSAAMECNLQAYPEKTATLSSIRLPIPVKKQEKYNISRWAVTGRDDLWLNTMCHRVAKYLDENPISQNVFEQWAELCELWASDLRTHITEKRWLSLKSKLSNILDRYNIRDPLYSIPTSTGLSSSVSTNEEEQIFYDPEGIYVTLKTTSAKLKLNLRRGGVIHSLSFAVHDFTPIIGTLPLGSFQGIQLGADYYSGGVIIELPRDHARVTDLEPCCHIIQNFEGGCSATLSHKTKIGTISKTYTIYDEHQYIDYAVSLQFSGRPFGSVRLGNFTLIDESFVGQLSLSCKNGGPELEHYKIDEDCDHGRSVSSIISCQTGFGATNGILIIGDGAIQIKFEWDPSQCAAMPLLVHKTEGNRHFTRLQFSVSETDETTRVGGSIPAFFVRIHALQNG